MSAQLLLVGNPARRKARKSRKARSPAQKAATRRMLAANRARKAPARRRARKSTAVTLRNNPVKRRSPRRAPAVARRRTRRNPDTSRVALTLNSVKNVVTTSAIGAAGAVGVDIVFGYMKPYLPAAIATPGTLASPNWGYLAAKGAVAVATGVALSKVKMIGSANAGKITQGSITVMLHSVLQALVASNMSTVPLGQYLGNSPGGKVLPMMNATRNLRGVGAYVSGAQRDAVIR